MQIRRFNARNHGSEKRQDARLPIAREGSAPAEVRILVRDGKPLTPEGKAAAGDEYKQMSDDNTKSLRRIEKIWDSPMGNSRTTRIRFAMWDTLRLAARHVDGDARRTILRLLREDEAQFEKSGHGRAVAYSPKASR